jgi:Zn-dependent protease
MPDLTIWAIPFYRAFGILVKVHILFFVVTIGLFLRQYFEPGNIVSWGDIFLFTVVMLFGVILLHEYGHCFGGRAVGGEATQILIWPLGGLAYVELPHQPRAHFFTVLCGPLVNFGFVIVCSLVILLAGYFPNLNPLSNPYVSELRGFDGKLYTSNYGLSLYKTGTTEQAPIPQEVVGKLNNPYEIEDALLKRPDISRAKLPFWMVWVNRLLWINWVLLLFNLVPAYPLDGGQLLHAFLWQRLDYRRATIIAGYTGMAFAFLFMVASIFTNSALLMGLSIFMLFSSAQKLQSLETEEGMYGDFSQGYTSLERDEPAPRPARPNFIKRWLQARKSRRIQREMEQRQQDDERMDQLLDKIAKFGKDSLTSEEQRFMERVSARYRNK